MTTTRAKLIKIGVKVVRHACRVTIKLAEAAVPRRLFETIFCAFDGPRLPILAPRRSPLSNRILAQWIDERSRAGGLSNASFGEEVVTAVGPCTGDIIRLARTVFDLYAAHKTKDAIAVGIDAIALREWHDEFAARWHPLTATQRGVLRALAKGLQPQSARAIKLYHLNTAATAQTALKALIESQLVIRTDSGKPIIDNPFSRRWVNAFDSTIVS